MVAFVLLFSFLAFSVVHVVIQTVPCLLPSVIFLHVRGLVIFCANDEHGSKIASRFLDFYKKT